MKDEIFFTDEFRKSVWEKFADIEFKIQSLKGIVQNSMPIKKEYINELGDDVNNVVEEIYQIRSEIASEFWRKKYE